MHSPKLSLLAVLFVTGCGSGYTPYKYTDIDHSPEYAAGTACAAQADCGTDSACVEGKFPGGYCTRSCVTGSDCVGSNDSCAIYGESEQGMCVATCASPGTRSSCRSGYTCWSFNNSSDGYCFPGEQPRPPPPPPPPAKSVTGAACSQDSQCEAGACYGNWPGGYCGAELGCGDDCGTNGICLAKDGQKFCVASCAQPNTKSSCRTGYTCRPFAAPRTDGFCYPESSGSGGGGGAGGGSGGSGGGSGGGTGGGSGGSGGGSPVPTTINYQVTSVTGSYTGGATHVESASRTDTLASNMCDYTSSNAATAFIGANMSTPSFSLSGTAHCNAGHATSTAAPACTTQTVNLNGVAFDVLVTVSGWTDDALVSFRVRYPPVGLPGCNYANVLWSGIHEWSMEVVTTVGKFRAGQPFKLQFAGARHLATSNKTSDVAWYFEMMVEPL